MIILKNLDLIVGENQSKPLEKGGELEMYVSKPIQQFMIERFGIICEVEINKE